MRHLFLIPMLLLAVPALAGPPKLTPPRRTVEERIADLEWDVAQLVVDEPPAWRPKPYPKVPPIAEPPSRNVTPASLPHGPPQDMLASSVRDDDHRGSGDLCGCERCGCAPTKPGATAKTIKVVRRTIPQAPKVWSNDDMIAARIASLGPTVPQFPYVPSTIWFPPSPSPAPTPMRWIYTPPPNVSSYTGPVTYYRTPTYWPGPRGPYNGAGYSYGAACNPMTGRCGGR